MRRSATRAKPVAVGWVVILLVAGASVRVVRGRSAEADVPVQHIGEAASAPPDATAGRLGVVDRAPIHVAVFGDSIVEGNELVGGDDLRWTSLLALSLDDALDVGEIRITNEGVGGQSIVSPRAAFLGPDGRIIGGTMYDKVRTEYADPSSDIPDVVVLVPSINEILVSQGANVAGRTAIAVLGIEACVEHLVSIGVDVVVLPMLPVGDAWDARTGVQVNETVAEINAALAAKGLLTAVDYPIDRDGIAGVDPSYFVNLKGEGDLAGDDLHPGPIGNAAIASAVRHVFVELRP